MRIPEGVEISFWWDRRDAERCTLRVERTFSCQAVTVGRIVRIDHDPNAQGCRWASPDFTPTHDSSGLGLSTSPRTDRHGIAKRQCCRWLAVDEMYTGHDRIIEAWRIGYNTNRPHTSLNGLTPTEFAAR